MRYHVRHQTSYSYSKPIPYAIQSLRLTPQPYQGLRVLSWQVDSERRRPLPSITDGFGNVTHCHSVNHPHSTTTVRVHGEVETQDTGGIVYGAPEPLPPPFFRHPTFLTAPSPSLRQLAADHQGGASDRDRLMALAAAVGKQLTYRAPGSRLPVPAAETLARGTGGAEDCAHVFIAAARLLGIPARYVSGYLWTGEGGDSQAAHAWAEAFVDGLGWFGFDPVSGRTGGPALVSERHIRAAVGLDYWSAAPVRSIRRGDADEALHIRIQVMQARVDQ